MWLNSLRAAISAWLNASQRSRVDVSWRRNEQVCQGVKCKALERANGLDTELFKYIPLHFMLNFNKELSTQHVQKCNPHRRRRKRIMKLYLNVLLTSFAFFWRVAFSWHPPVFFSSYFGHVTPPLSCACHVTVRSCCRQKKIVLYLTQNQAHNISMYNK